MKKYSNILAKVSVASAALLLPVSFLLGKVVEYFLKSSNPSNVDVTQPLAYLAHILWTSIITFGILFVISLVTGLLALRGPSKKLAKIGLSILIVELVVTIILLGLFSG